MPRPRSRPCATRRAARAASAPRSRGRAAGTASTTTSPSADDARLAVRPDRDGRRRRCRRRDRRGRRRRRRLHRPERPRRLDGRPRRADASRCRRPPCGARSTRSAPPASRSASTPSTPPWRSPTSTRGADFIAVGADVSLLARGSEALAERFVAAVGRQHPLVVLTLTARRMLSSDPLPDARACHRGDYEEGCLRTHRPDRHRTGAPGLRDRRRRSSTFPPPNRSPRPSTARPSRSRRSPTRTAPACTASTAKPGELVVDYTASVIGASEPPSVSDADLLVYTRPSRYSESDSLAATAGAEFLGITGRRGAPRARSRRGSARASPTSRVRRCRPTARCARSSTARASAVTTHT